MTITYERTVKLLINECKNDLTLQEDMDIIAESGLPLDELKNSNLLITGATGLVGSQLVRAVAACNRHKNTGIRILALVRSREKAERIFGELIERDDVQLVVGDVTNPYDTYIGNDVDVDYIIHTASITASKQMITMPVETIMIAIEGTRNILELAKAKNSRSVIYVSSMEVYGSFNAQNGESKLVTEQDMGYIDPLVVRSNYPLGKRMCENLCAAYFSQYGVPVKIARLSQTFGAGILPGENRVFAQFARSAMNGQNIVLHTKGLSEGNYCYTRDTVSALLTMLAKAKNGEAYNISNENCHITIADMAKMVCEKIAGGNIEVVFDIPESNLFGYAADTKMTLDSSKMRSLGWTRTVDLEEAYIRMMQSMRYTGV